LEQKDVDPMPPRSAGRRKGRLPRLGLWWYREELRRRLRSLAPRRIVCVSDANRLRLVRDHGFAASKMHTVRNGADVERFRRDPAQGLASRRAWGVPDDALVFGAIGRLHRIKGYATVLDALPVVLQARPARDIRLVLVGEGPEEDALRAQAERLGLQERVVFVRFTSRPWEALSALDVFVMPSYAEGLPLALAEAMACECGAIATPVGGIPEAITEPDLGWLVPPGDAAAFAGAMIEAADRSGDELRAMGARARAHAEAEFDASVQLVRMAEIIESLAPEGHREPAGGAVGGGRVHV
jgi:glycosyltransferase involved in cell wall biosynthesis